MSSPGTRQPSVRASPSFGPLQLAGAGHRDAPGAQQDCAAWPHAQHIVHGADDRDRRSPEQRGSKGLPHLGEHLQLLAFDDAAIDADRSREPDPNDGVGDRFDFLRVQARPETGRHLRFSGVLMRK